MTVFAFTFKDGLRKKAFIISTVVVVAVLLAACALANLMAGGDSGETGGTGGTPAAPAERSNTCYVIDIDGIMPGAVVALSDAVADVRFIQGTPDKLDDYKAEIEADSKKAAVTIRQQDGRLSLEYYVTDFMAGVPTDAMTAALRGEYVTAALATYNIPGLAELVMAEPEVRTNFAGGLDLSGYMMGIMLVMLMFFAVYYYGYFVAMSVAAEKTSRVMETLVVSARPSRILVGKCLAMGLLGLTQMATFLLVGAFGYRFLLPAGFSLAGITFDLSAFTVPSALLVLVYFIFGYTLYSMISSVCGATVSRAEDVNTAMMPSIMISMVSFFAAYFVMLMPTGTIAKQVVTYIPFTSPFIMPFRLLNERLPSADILISLGLLLAAIVVVTWFSVRLYTASVLHYGQRLKLKDLFNTKH